MPIDEELPETQRVAAPESVLTFHPLTFHFTNLRTLIYLHPPELRRIGLEHWLSLVVSLTIL
jgi:hypothetical protein